MEITFSLSEPLGGEPEDLERDLIQSDTEACPDSLKAIYLTDHEFKTKNCYGLKMIYDGDKKFTLKAEGLTPSTTYWLSVGCGKRSDCTDMKDQKGNPISERKKISFRELKTNHKINLTRIF